MPKNADQILKIVLPKRPRPDKLLWGFDKNGNYQPVALGISLKLPRFIKEKSFRMVCNLETWFIGEIKDIHKEGSTKHTPNDRKSLEEKTFATSMMPKEGNPSHVLLNCKASQKTWRITYFFEDMKPFANQDLLSVLQALVAKRSRAEIEFFVALCWVNWHSRNLFVFQGKREDYHASLGKVEAILHSYKKIKSPVLPFHVNQSSSRNQHLEISSNKMVKGDRGSINQAKESSGRLESNY